MGTFIFIPIANYFGSSEFEYSAVYHEEYSSTGTINLEVIPVNDAPYFTSEIEDQQLINGETIEFVLEAEDVEGDLLVLTTFPLQII